MDGVVDGVVAAGVETGAFAAFSNGAAAFRIAESGVVSAGGATGRPERPGAVSTRRAVSGVARDVSRTESRGESAPAGAFTLEGLCSASDAPVPAARASANAAPKAAIGF